MQSIKQYVSVIFLCVGLLAGCAGTTRQESTGQYIDNTVITTRVKTRLLADPIVKGLPITVTSYKGTVSLTGHVDSTREKRRAVSIAWSVPGVANVIDNLTVVKHY